MKKKLLFLSTLLFILLTPVLVKAEELSTPTNVRWKEGETPIVTWNPVPGANYYLVDIQKANMDNMTYQDNYYQYYVSTNEVDISTSLIADGSTVPYRFRVKAIYADDNKQIESEFSEFSESFLPNWSINKSVTNLNIDDDELDTLFREGRSVTEAAQILCFPEELLNIKIADMVRRGYEYENYSGNIRLF